MSPSSVFSHDVIIRNFKYFTNVSHVLKDALIPFLSTLVRTFQVEHGFFYRFFKLTTFSSLAMHILINDSKNQREGYSTKPFINFPTSPRACVTFKFGVAHMNLKPISLSIEPCQLQFPLLHYKRFMTSLTAHPRKP